MNMPTAEIRQMQSRLESLLTRADKLEAGLTAELALVHPKLRDGATNLVHYVALRQTDLSEMQRQMEDAGLSPLSRAECHTKASINTVLKVLRKLYFDEQVDLDAERREFSRSKAALARHSSDLLGQPPDDRLVRIMVTLPGDAACNDKFVPALINAGVNIARINTAHDEPETWLRMVEAVNRANQAMHTSCKIVMDLMGTKIRTGALEPGPRVLRVRPKRDPTGRVIAPRRLRLIAGESGPLVSGGSTVPVLGPGMDDVRPGDTLTFRDTRGKKRKLLVTDRDDKGLVVELWKKAYLETGARLVLRRSDSGERVCFKIGALPPMEQPLLLRVGDTLLLHGRSEPGEPAVSDSEGSIVRAAHIACRPPDVIRFVASGEPVFLNDGKIAGIVRSATNDELSVEITQAKATGSRLRGDKGINFPDSKLGLSGLTEADRQHLNFIVTHASAVGLSFVNRPHDIFSLHDNLAGTAESIPGVILKIETQSAFNNLPRLLLAAMQKYPVGVMIARGDLAVECGWERLAEIQEEILWLCEAAGVPVIWATQVLEGEATKGRPSRAEITDAAMAQRADCVMLNKGPHIIRAIHMLDGILKKMQRHQFKKTPMLRKLAISNISLPAIHPEP